MGRLALVLSAIPTAAVVTVNAGVWKDDWPGRIGRAIERSVSSSYLDRKVSAVRCTGKIFALLDEEIAANPESTARLVSIVDESVIRSLSRCPPAEEDLRGWAVDLKAGSDGELIILDRWGRMVRGYGERASFDAEFPFPSTSVRFIAMTLLPDGKRALLADDGSVYIRAGDEWRRVQTSFTVRELPKFLRGVDISFDFTQNEIVVLDNTCDLHFPECGSRLEAIHTHTNLGRRLLRNPYIEDAWTDSWCVMTSLGRLAETTREFDPPWRSPFTHPAIVDGILTPDGRGAWLLDILGGVHAVGDAPAVESFYPIPAIGRFVRMAPSHDGKTLYLLDRAYRVYTLDVLTS